MKRTISALIVLALFAAPLSAMPQKVNSDIAKVTVFPGRAQVTRVVSISLTAGEHQLMFEDLSPTAEDASFHAAIKGTGDITLLGLSHKVVPHLEARQTRIAEIEKRISDIEKNRREPVNDRIGILEQQKELLLAMGKTGGEQMNNELKVGSLDVKSWEAAYGFFSRELTVVTDSLRVLRQALEKTDAELALLKSELQSIQSDSNRDNKSVLVDLRLAQAGTAEVSLDYVVPNATWTPLYDARLSEDNEVELSYSAEVKQRTGEDWNDVELMLSTSRPAEGVEPGELMAWTLAIPEPRLAYAPAIQASGSVHARGGRSGETTYVIDGASIKDPIGGGFDQGYGSSANALVAQISRDLASVSTVFIIKRKMVIPSGTEAVRAPINQWTLAGNMRFVSRPRNHAGVYRFSTLTNQEEAPLLPGTVNIFAGLDFLGQTTLAELVAQGQTFELPFGLDNDIAVKREIIARKKHVGDNDQSIQETIKITLTNHSKTVRILTVEEPLPTSNDSRIKVELGSVVPKWQTKDVQGKALWQLTLIPNGDTTIEIPYKIEYPQGIMVPGL